MSEILTALYGSPDKPLKIGDIEIPCYVLNDNKRVIVQSGLMRGLGISRGSSGGTGGDRLAKFIAGKTLSPYISDELIAVTQNPIKFKVKGNTAYGYEATVLSDICDAVLEARKDEKLLKQQKHIANRCEILLRGFARVGIIALIDEATGYQEIRDRLALQKILEKYLLSEYAKWAKRFPNVFYQEMFKLNNWQYNPLQTKRPGVIGKYTNNVVYERLAPGVIDELKRNNPKDEKGHRKTKHHQWLTEEVGHPKLQEHLTGVIALMKASPNWKSFIRLLERAYPKFGHTIPLNFGEEIE